MSDPLSCDFEQAELNHLRDALAMTPAQRWQWLRQTMDFCEQVARQRAAEGLVTLSASCKVLWSPELAREWEGEDGAGDGKSWQRGEALVSSLAQSHGAQAWLAPLIPYLQLYAICVDFAFASCLR